MSREFFALPRWFFWASSPLLLVLFTGCETVYQTVETDIPAIHAERKGAFIELTLYFSEQNPEITEGKKVKLKADFIDNNLAKGSKKPGFEFELLPTSVHKVNPPLIVDDIGGGQVRLSSEMNEVKLSIPLSELSIDLLNQDYKSGRLQVSLADSASPSYREIFRVKDLSLESISRPQIEMILGSDHSQKGDGRILVVPLTIIATYDSADLPYGNFPPEERIKNYQKRFDQIWQQCGIRAYIQSFHTLNEGLCRNRQSMRDVLSPEVLHLLREVKKRNPETSQSIPILEVSRTYHDLNESKDPSFTNSFFPNSGNTRTPLTKAARSYEDEIRELGIDQIIFAEELQGPDSALLAHEIGHVLIGFEWGEKGHSTDPKNLMFPTVGQFNDNKLTPEQCDLARQKIRNAFQDANP